MNTVEQIRAIDAELLKRLPANVGPLTRRDLALDIHQAIANACAGSVQNGVDTLVGNGA